MYIQTLEVSDLIWKEFQEKTKKLGLNARKIAQFILDEELSEENFDKTVEKFLKRNLSEISK